MMTFKKISSRIFAAVCTCAVLSGVITPIPAEAAEDVITIKVCNWEEYIDEGGWDDDEVIDLESGDIFGENALYEDF